MLPKKNTEQEIEELLDDIEQFGGQREVALLNELLENQEFGHLSDRIQNILKKCNDDSNSSISENENLKPFNVFEDLFRICDTEAKLILMDEIVAVGDEKEIPFLIDLLEDENLHIRLKAQKVFEELQNKMMIKNILPLENTKITSHQKISDEYSILINELEIKSEEPNDIFDIEFEFSEIILPIYESVESTIETNKVERPYIMKHIYSFLDKIRDKSSE